MTIVDLSAPLNRRTPIYPGDPPFVVSWFSTFEDRIACGSMISMGAHTGTHVDAPLHFLRLGKDIASISLDNLIGQASAFDILKGPDEEITVDDLSQCPIDRGDIVLLHTGWSQRIDTPDFFNVNWPGLSVDAALYLVERGVKAIGVDTPSLDSLHHTEQGAPAHRIVLEAGIPIIETLVNLKEVVGKRFTFVGAPLRLENCEASPIRAIAMIE